jgi:uncharacterized protein (TIGR00297 family)
MIEYLIPLVLVGLAIVFKALDLTGAIVATLFAYIILLRHNIFWLYIIFGFFLIGSLSTVFKRTYKNKYSAHKTRTIKNVVANGLLAVLMALLGQFYAFIGAVAAACGDTLSSEIGMLSKETPVMINTFKKAKPGVNGAITWLGTIMSVVGGAAIGLLAWPIFPYPKIILIGAVCGLFGSLFDSYIGAVLENQKFLDNFGTNLITTVFGALIGVIFFVWF